MKAEEPRARMLAIQWADRNLTSEATAAFLSALTLAQQEARAERDAEVKALRAMLRQVEWDTDSDGFISCRACDGGSWIEGNNKHKTDCPLRALLEGK